MHHAQYYTKKHLTKNIKQNQVFFLPLIPVLKQTISIAQEMLNTILSELRSRLSQATEESAFHTDISMLEAELNYSGHVLTLEGHGDAKLVKNAEAKLQQLKDHVYTMAVQIQKHARILLAKMHVKRLKQHRDDDIDDIFGDLGMAMQMTVEKGFEHKEVEVAEGDEQQERGK